jgi:UDP-N-acetylglucosamine acyltransferase
MAIHPTATVDPGAAIAGDVEIGPYCVIGPEVFVGEGSRLVAHVHVAGHTSIGAGCVVYPFASLGTPPQSTHYRGGRTRLTVGANCDIREGATINVGTEDGGGLTQVGDNCFLMAGSHVGHDCHVGNRVVFANNAVLGGHVSIGDHVFLGGNSAVHQFVRVGEGAIIAGVSGVRGDVIPFGFALGQIAELVGLNIVGLTRSGYARVDMHVLRRAYRALFAGEGTLHARMEAVAREHGEHVLVGKVIAFLRAEAKRPLTLPARRRAGAARSDDHDGD